METTVGYQRLTNVGNLVPTGSPIRVYSVDSHGASSFSALTFHNGLVSSTTVTVYLHLMSDTQGDIHQEWGNGVLFEDGVWLDTGPGGAVTVLVGYSRVTA